MRAAITGVGAYLPAKIVDNRAFEATLETNHEWIVERTGIHRRHIAADGEFASDLAVKAGEDVLKRTKIAPESIDFLILATTTPDDTMPSTATKVQHRLGLKNAAAFDLNAACSGFVYALSMARAFIESGQAKRVMVIGAETYSRIMNWQDRGTCILFGDGAGAVIVDAVPESENRGIYYSKLYSDGQYTELLRTTGGVSTTQQSGVLTMAGKEIFRHGVAKMSESVAEGLRALNLTAKQIDWVVPHQANARIIRSIAEKLGVPESKLVMSVQDHANTSAASIPLALYKAVNEKKLQKGQWIVLTALGAGLTWGCSILRW